MVDYRRDHRESALLERLHQSLVRPLGLGTHRLAQHHGVENYVTGFWLMKFKATGTNSR
jgi:hypothetical protein